ncbi:hypothetical protein MVEN_01116000 [Mycena venus]|uniref:Mid2 domain-containing protein n=1 Tax=Mycena venus TaxID=2733690 RepID=A0A8H7CXK9_9AGAR|nr:hypothetical protein MVEN_01116000 [Mycena venus]
MIHIFLAICFLCAFTATSRAESTQTAVTLWQFGRPRLRSGQVTLPLLPMGTANDGSATTYLYQVLNPAEVITTDESGFVTKTTPSAISRTIVASASGWVEAFETMQAISCGFVDSTFGQCLDETITTTTRANSGAPTPVVIPISANLTQISVSPVPTSSAASNPVLSPSLSATNTSGLVKRPTVSAIVGVVIGTLLLIVGMVIALWWCRRRRLNRMAKDLSRQPYVPMPVANALDAVAQSEMGEVSPASATTSEYSSTHVQLGGTHDGKHFKGPQRGATSTVGPTSAWSLPSEVSTTELAWTIHHRIQNQDFNGIPLPPA